MKKLLTLMVVLCLASLSSAAMLISVDGDTNHGGAIEIAPSDVITIDVYDDTGVNDLLYLDIFDETGTSVLFSLSNGQLGPGIGDGPSGESGFYDAGTYMENEITTAWLPETPRLPGVIYLVDLHCEGEGEVTVQIWEQGGGVLSDQLVITQTPEPMTIALLGIGGLFLRRRK